MSSNFGLALPSIGQVRLDQGQTIMTRIRGNSFNVCTLGYISKDNARGYAAAHCGKLGDTVYNSKGQTIGRVAALNTAHGRDHMRIALNQNVRGVNPYTGDKMISWRDARVGDTVCHYGQTTKQTQCGRITRVDPHRIWSDNSNTRRGDSGGPVWIPGRGAIGVVSSYLTISQGNQVLGSRTSIDTVL